jgi:hypothetical protein
MASRIRPFLVIPLLLAGAVYTAYLSAPRFGLDKVLGKVATSTCYGNQAPYGCSVEVEYYYKGALSKASFTGSYDRKYMAFDSVDMWINPKNVSDVTIEVGWSRSGLFLSSIFLFALALYVFSFVTITHLNSGDNTK